MATYAKFRLLTKARHADIRHTFRRLAQLLRNSGHTATLRCTILMGDQSKSWTFELSGRDCRVRDAGDTVPNLEIITREITWWEIAEGRLSPLDAFLQGRMRILGDTELGSRLLRHVAEGDGATSLCEG